MKVEAYLNFDGRTDEAIEFYGSAVRAELVDMIRFKDHQESIDSGMVPKGAENKVMHSSFRIGESLVMASDMACGNRPVFSGTTLALHVADPAEAQQRFDALAKGGKVDMPLGPTFFSASFGTLTDRFGVSWMVVAPPAGA